MHIFLEQFFFDNKIVELVKILLENNLREKHAPLNATSC